MAGSSKKKSTLHRRLHAIEQEDRLVRGDIKYLSKTLTKPAVAPSSERSHARYSIDLKRFRSPAQQHWERTAPHNQHGNLLNYLSTGSFQPAGGFKRVSDPIQRHRRIFVAVFIGIILFIAGSLIFM